MGMDIFGLSPANETGEYFRNNVWWWRPLWLYCCDIAPDIITESIASEGHMNGGAGLKAEAAHLLADRLYLELWEGRTAKYASDYMLSLADLPRETCSICNGTGIRSDAIGIEQGWPTKELKPEVQILTGRTHGSCNACSGVGSTEHWASHYPFSVENVERFADFCQHSGGFEIC